MDNPAGLAKTLTLDASAPINDICEMAKRSYNSAHRGKLAYQAFTFLAAVVLVLAAIYAVLSFNDEEGARGTIGLIVSVGALLTSGFFGVLTKSASDDEKAMWERFEKSCGPSPAADTPGSPGAGAAA